MSIITLSIFTLTICLTNVLKSDPIYIPFSFKGKSSSVILISPNENNYRIKGLIGNNCRIIYEKAEKSPLSVSVVIDVV